MIRINLLPHDEAPKVRTFKMPNVGAAVVPICIAVGVLGASGYAGRELCGLIQRHPALSLAYATANSQRGETAQTSRALRHLRAHGRVAGVPRAPRRKVTTHGARIIGASVQLARPVFPMQFLTARPT